MRNYSVSANRRKNQSKRRGIVLIEFCVAFFCVFVPLCLGLLQYGIILQTTLAMNNLSREAGRFASVKSLGATNDDELKNYIVANATSLGAKIKDPTTDITITPACNTAALPNSRVRYSPITVVIRYDLSQKVFLSSLFNIPIFSSVYSTSVVMVMQ